MRLHSILVIAVLLAPAAAQAQSAPAVGELVRVQHEGQRIEGSLVALGQDSLVIATALGSSVVAPPPRIIYRHVGHTSHGRAFLTGAVIGGLVGAAGGVALGYMAGKDETSEYMPQEAVMAFGAIVFGAGGFLVGGLVGLSFAGDQWEAVRIRPTVGLGSDPRGVVVGFEARF